MTIEFHLFSLRTLESLNLSSCGLLSDSLRRSLRPLGANVRVLDLSRNRIAQVQKDDKCGIIRQCLCYFGTAKIIFPLELLLGFSTFIFLFVESELTSKGIKRCTDGEQKYISKGI